MNAFPRFSTLTQIAWVIVVWFGASYLYGLWLAVTFAKGKPMWFRLAFVVNLVAATAVYRGVLW
jgi:hypothetical protein